MIEVLLLAKDEALLFVKDEGSFMGWDESLKMTVWYEFDELGEPLEALVVTGET